MTLKYHPIHKPIPSGWVYFGPLKGNHGRYSFLIIKVGK